MVNKSLHNFFVSGHTHLYDNKITWSTVREHMINFNNKYLKDRANLSKALLGGYNPSQVTASNAAAGLPNGNNPSSLTLDNATFSTAAAAGVASGQTSQTGPAVPPPNAATLARLAGFKTVGLAGLATSNDIISSGGPSIGVTPVLPKIPKKPIKPDESAYSKMNNNNNNLSMNHQINTNNNNDNNNNNLLDLNNINLNLLDLSKNTHGTPAPIKLIKNSMRTQILRRDQTNIKKQLDLMGDHYESASIRSKDNTNFISGISMDINEQMKEIRQSMNDQRLEYKQRLDLQRKEYDEQNKQLKDVIRDLAIEKIEKKEIINKCNDLQNHIKNLQLQGTNGTTNNKDINTNGTTLENIANTNGISLTENENENKNENIDEEMSSDNNGKNDENENVSFQDLIEEANINKEDVKDKNVQHNFNVGANDRNRVVKISFPMNKIKGKSASAKATINLLKEKQVLSKIEYDDKSNKPKIYQKILNNGAILNQVWFKDDVATNGFKSSCKYDKKRVYVNNWINDDELQRKRNEDVRYKMNDNNNWNAYNNNNNNNFNGNGNGEMYYGNRSNNSNGEMYNSNGANQPWQQDIIAYAQQQATRHFNNNGISRGNFTNGPSNRGGRGGSNNSGASSNRGARGGGLSSRGGRNNAGGGFGGGYYGNDLWNGRNINNYNNGNF